MKLKNVLKLEAVAIRLLCEADADKAPYCSSRDFLEREEEFLEYFGSTTIACGFDLCPYCNEKPEIFNWTPSNDWEFQAKGIGHCGDERCRFIHEAITEVGVVGATRRRRLKVLFGKRYDELPREIRSEAILAAILSEKAKKVRYSKKLVAALK